MNRNTILKFEFLILFIILCFFWAADYLPMIDLPQHAAQATLLVDLIKGQSSFSDIVEINFLTPYWIAYGPLALLTVFFDIEISLKLFISLVLIGYFYSVKSFYKNTGTPFELAILSLPLFFGFSYDWGFLTFISSVPIGLYYLSLISKNLEKIDNRSFLVKASLLGLFLFLSHALGFVFFIFLGFLMQISHKIQKKNLNLTPFIYPYILFFLLLLSFIQKQDPLANYYSYGDQFFVYSSGQNRLLELFIYPWSSIHDNHTLIVSLTILFLPFLLGFRLSKKPLKYIYFASSITIWFCLPHYFNNVFFIYQRFSFVIIIIYFTLFENSKHIGFPSQLYLRKFITPTLALLLLHKPLLDIYLFNQETSGFKGFLEQVSPRKRVLSLVFDKQSSKIANPNMYLHFPLWYQAGHSGFVEYNFAWFSPQVVRFINGEVSEMKPGSEWMPHLLGSINNCKFFDGVIIRSLKKDVPDNLLIGECEFKFAHSDNSWLYFKNSSINME